MVRGIFCRQIELPNIISRKINPTIVLSLMNYCSKYYQNKNSELLFHESDMFNEHLFHLQFYEVSFYKLKMETLLTSNNTIY